MTTYKLRDYTHAAKTFTSTPGYTLAPKLSFLFHTRFIYTQPGAVNAGSNTTTLSVLTKTAELPKFNIEVESLNKYNKKAVVQKRIIYEPLAFTLHDDTANNVRNMWLAYNQYYYADSNISQQAYDLDDTYSATRLATKYGLDNGQTTRFLKSIELYSMSNHVYTKYTLLNPLIESFDFDTHDYSEGAKTMQASMRVQYENVLYSEGPTESIPGFGQSSQYYDNEYSYLTPSDLTYPNTNPVVDSIDTPLINMPGVSVRNDQQSAQYNEVATIVAGAIRDPLMLSSNTIKAQKVKVNGVESASNRQRFNFPTATKTSQRGFQTPVTGQALTFVSNRSDAVSSNGVKIGTPPKSTIGSKTSNSEIAQSLPLYISPKVPDGLTPTELQLFNISFPPLPATDGRTKGPPYV